MDESGDRRCRRRCERRPLRAHPRRTRSGAGCVPPSVCPRSRPGDRVPRGSARAPARSCVVMSSLANVIELPVRQEFEERDSLEHDMVLALATADDVASGMDAVVGRIRRDSAAARAEWWAKDEDGALELVAADG